MSLLIIFFSKIITSKNVKKLHVVFDLPKIHNTKSEQFKDLRAVSPHCCLILSSELLSEQCEQPSHEPGYSTQVLPTRKEVTIDNGISALHYKVGKVLGGVFR